MSDIKVKVAGRTLTVFKAAFVNGLQRSVKIAEAGQSTPPFYDKLALDESVVRYVHRLLYPSLISCTDGKLPSEEEFLKLPDADAQSWVDAAEKLNPDWFSLNGNAAKKDDSKKNKP